MKKPPPNPPLTRDQIRKLFLDWMYEDPARFIESLKQGMAEEAKQNRLAELNQNGQNQPNTTKP